MTVMDDLYVVHFALPGAVPLDLDEDTEQNESEGEDRPDVKMTFAHFGLAYYRASVLEHEIVNILSMTRLVTARHEAEQLLSSPWDDKFKATMGVLVKQLEQHAHNDPDLVRDLIEAMRLRNYLAHAFWRERAEDFLTEAGRSRMINDLRAARNHFIAVDERLTNTAGRLAIQQWGVTDEVIESYTRDQRERVANGELNVPLDIIERTREYLRELVNSQPGVQVDTVGIEASDTATYSDARTADPTR